MGRGRVDSALRIFFFTRLVYYTGPIVKKCKLLSELNFLWYISYVS